MCIRDRQTAESALEEVSRSLIEARQLAVHAANDGANDQFMQEADEYEFKNIVDQINRIASNTQFGKTFLLDGSRGGNGVSTGENLEFVEAGGLAKSSGAGGYAVHIQKAASRATNTGIIPLTQEIIDSEEKLTLAEGGRTVTFRTIKGDNIEKIKKLTKDLDIPWFAIGGINSKNISFDGKPSKIIEFNTHQVKRLVVKPTKEGSSLGVSIIENKPDFIKTAIEKASKYGEFMIEEFIEGSEITVARVGNENFPPVQIIPENQFYDFQAKYNSFNTKYTKADYSSERQSELDQLITQINVDFNCKAWSRVDLIDDGENFYFLELNTVPGMTNTSLVPKAAKFAGLDFDRLVMQIIKSSLD